MNHGELYGLMMNNIIDKSPEWVPVDAIKNPEDYAFHDCFAPSIDDIKRNEPIGMPMNNNHHKPLIEIGQCYSYRLQKNNQNKHSLYIKSKMTRDGVTIIKDEDKWALSAGVKLICDKDDYNQELDSYRRLSCYPWEGSVCTAPKLKNCGIVNLNYSTDSNNNTIGNNFNNQYSSSSVKLTGGKYIVEINYHSNSPIKLKKTNNKNMSEPVPDTTMGEKATNSSTEGEKAKENPEKTVPSEKTNEKTEEKSGNNPKSGDKRKVDEINKTHHTNYKTSVDDMSPEDLRKLAVSLLEDKHERVVKKKKRHGPVLSKALGVDENSELIKMLITNSTLQKASKKLINDFQLITEQTEKMKNYDQLKKNYDDMQKEIQSYKTRISQMSGRQLNGFNNLFNNDPIIPRKTTTVGNDYSKKNNDIPPEQQDLISAVIRSGLHKTSKTGLNGLYMKTKEVSKSVNRFTY